MKIYVLSENHAGDGFEAEHGLSFFIDAGTKILFDAGQSDLFIKNAILMGLNISDVDVLVLSHGHYDHGNGMIHLKGYPLILHPACFSSRYSSRTGDYCGLSFDAETASRNFDLKMHTEPFWISPKIVFLGKIPRINGFEDPPSGFENESGNVDHIPDDTALAFLLSDGLVVVSGCAHAGICNIVSHAIGVTGVQEVQAVVGGFHLKNDDIRTELTIRWLKDFGVKSVVPLHCTSGAAHKALSDAFGSPQVRAGNHLFYT
jgi:7,8-dihydropterin-6-yl-methyl-4-(beta-D-ribofuranosyl)aminobenzene 5'-phosphate synthase